MSAKLFGIEFSPEEITIDHTGKVIINNSKLAEAIRKEAICQATDAPDTNNCGCNNGCGTADAPAYSLK
ncbi:hypothetical protein [Neobacillus niacini]|uniref:hypothetical protein n=1 Tax=Neobacillus niacini TaxID=86668 RepID=UPI0005ED7830|nr:hypothetical protein [Neobacillus niacini]